MFFETLRQQEEIRQKAENIKNQDNLTDEVKKEKLEKEAVEMAKLFSLLDKNVVFNISNIFSA